MSKRKVSLNKYVAPDEGAQLWERMPGETDAAFDAFKVWIDLDPQDRKMPAVWRVWAPLRKYKRVGKVIPERLYRYRADWDWDKRAEAYDLWKNEARVRADERRRIRERDDRRMILQGLKGQVAAYIEKLQTRSKSGGTVNPQEIRAAAHIVTVYNRESREEYDDLPTQRVDFDLKIQIDEEAKLAKQRFIDQLARALGLDSETGNTITVEPVRDQRPDEPPNPPASLPMGTLGASEPA